LPVNEEAPISGLLQGHLLDFLVVGDGDGTPKEGNAVTRVGPTGHEIVHADVNRGFIDFGIGAGFDFYDAQKIVRRLHGYVTVMGRGIVAAAADECGCGEESDKSEVLHWGKVYFV
jgi:hypothetical protein